MRSIPVWTGKQLAPSPAEMRCGPSSTPSKQNTDHACIGLAAVHRLGNEAFSDPACVEFILLSLGMALSPCRNSISLAGIARRCPILTIEFASATTQMWLQSDDVFDSATLTFTTSDASKDALSTAGYDAPRNIAVGSGETITIDDIR